MGESGREDCGGQLEGDRHDGGGIEVGMFGGEKRKYGVVAPGTRKFSFSGYLSTRQGKTGGSRELTRHMAVRHPEYWLGRSIHTIEEAYLDTAHEVPDAEDDGG